MSPIVSGGGGASGVISGVTVTGTAASGDVPVASSSSAGTWSLPPGYEFGYDQITSAVTVTSTTESSGTTVISCAAHTFDGAPVWAHFFSPWAQAQDSDVICSLFEGATQIGRLWDVSQHFATGTDSADPVSAWYRFTPSAGSHTYTVTAFSFFGGTISISAGAAGTGLFVPAFIRFIKV